MMLIGATLMRRRTRCRHEEYVPGEPRGPVSIDPETRDIVQNIYMRRYSREGELHDVEFETFPNVKDPAKAKK
jgi:hypothetical protein